MPSVKRAKQSSIKLRHTQAMKSSTFGLTMPEHANCLQFIFRKKALFGRSLLLIPKTRTEQLNALYASLFKKAQTILIYASLPAKLRPEAVSAACYISNMLSIKVLQSIISYEAFYKKKPAFQTYGYTAVIHMWLNRKPNLKTKWHLAHAPVLLMVTKPKINGGFGIVPESL